MKYHAHQLYKYTAHGYINIALCLVPYAHAEDLFFSSLERKVS